MYSTIKSTPPIITTDPPVTIHSDALGNLIINHIVIHIKKAEIAASSICEQKKTQLNEKNKECF